MTVITQGCISIGIAGAFLIGAGFIQSFIQDWISGKISAPPLILEIGLFMVLLMMMVGGASEVIAWWVR